MGIDSRVMGSSRLVRLVVFLVLMMVIRCLEKCVGVMTLSAELR